MSSWARVTFEPAASVTTDDIVDAVHDLVDEREEDFHTDGDGHPDLRTERGLVVWEETSKFERDTLYELPPLFDCAVVVYANDTADAGEGFLYERTEEGLLLTDVVSGGEGPVGRDVVDYFWRAGGPLGVAQ